MKKVFFIGTVLLCGMLILSNSAEAQSRKEKKAAKEAKKAEWEKKRAELMELRLQLEAEMNLLMEQSVQTPCADQSKSDDEYFRMLGTGDGIDLSRARRSALEDAQIKLREQIGQIILNLTAEYSEIDSKIQDNVKGKLEQRLLDRTIRTLSYSDKICEKNYMNDKEVMHCFYAVEISKKKILEAMLDAINGDENLKTICDTEKFRQFAEDYLKNTRTH